MLTDCMTLQDPHILPPVLETPRGQAMAATPAEFAGPSDHGIDGFIPWVPTPPSEPEYEG